MGISRVSRVVKGKGKIPKVPRIPRIPKDKDFNFIKTSDFGDWEEDTEVENAEQEENWDDWKEWHNGLKKKEQMEIIAKEKEKKRRKKKKKIKLKKSSKDAAAIKELKRRIRLQVAGKGFKRLEKEKEKYEIEWERNKDLVGLGLNGLLETGPERIVLRKVLEKLPKRKSYIRDQCQHRNSEGRRCMAPAVGNGQLCEAHGGRLYTGEGHDTVTSIIQTLLNKNSKYHPVVHPLDYIKMSQRGLSDAEIAAEFKVSIMTLKSWAEKYNDFGEAYEIGKALQEAWWLEKGKSGLDDTRNFNTPLYKFLTGNQLGYSDKVETKSHNTHTHGVLVVPGQVSIDDWEKNRRIKQIVNDEDDDEDDIVDV
jgi:hypothetical protein